MNIDSGRARAALADLQRIRPEVQVNARTLEVRIEHHAHAWFREWKFIFGCTPPLDNLFYYAVDSDKRAGIPLWFYARYIDSAVANHWSAHVVDCVSEE